VTWAKLFFSSVGIIAGI